MTNTHLLNKFRDATPVELARNANEFDRLVGQVRDLLGTVQELEDVLSAMKPEPARPAQGRAARIYELRKVLAPAD